jgi:hypothetical protein
MNVVMKVSVSQCPFWKQFPASLCFFLDSPGLFGSENHVSEFSTVKKINTDETQSSVGVQNA